MRHRRGARARSCALREADHTVRSHCGRLGRQWPRRRARRGRTARTASTQVYLSTARKGLKVRLFGFAFRGLPPACGRTRRATNIKLYGSGHGATTHRTAVRHIRSHQCARGTDARTDTLDGFTPNTLSGLIRGAREHHPSQRSERPSVPQQSKHARARDSCTLERLARERRPRRRVGGPARHVEPAY